MRVIAPAGWIVILGLLLAWQGLAQREAVASSYMSLRRRHSY